MPDPRLLGFVRLPDADLVRSLGVIADHLEEVADPRADVVRRGRLANSYTAFGTPAWSLRDYPGPPCVCDYSTHAAAVAELARRARACLGWERCGSLVKAGCGGSGWIRPNVYEDIRCDRCHGVGYVPAITPAAAPPVA